MARAKRLIDRFLTVAGNLNLPYTLDPSGLGDGAFPSGWIAPNWTIATGKGVCSPTLGSELFTDPGLEAAYTDGLCASLTKSNTPTVAESADVHGGSKAQSFLADGGDEGLYQYITPDANTWYLLSAWGKRTEGSGSRVHLKSFQGGSGPMPSNSNYSSAHNSATYAQRKAVHRSKAVVDQYLFIFPANQDPASDYDTVIIDDCSIKSITQGTMFALRKAKANVTVKAKYTWDRNGICGVVARANAQSNPNTFLIAYYLNYNELYSYVALEKCVAGVWTTLIADWSNSPTAGAGGTPLATQWLEIRCNGSTVQLFHNNIQVGADQTVSDVNGSYAGVFQSGGSQLESFFVG